MRRLVATRSSARRLHAVAIVEYARTIPNGGRAFLFLIFDFCLLAFAF
jgi:hypothetical protein